MENDPIPIEVVAQTQSNKANNQDISEVQAWEELEPMPEGEARVMTHQFLDVEGIEIEVCINQNGKYFVRHEFYWWLKHQQKTTEADYNNTIRHLQSFLLGLPTIKWSGYKFRIETIVFSEDDVEVESILLPLAMF